MMARIIPCNDTGSWHERYGKWIPIFLDDDPYEYVRTYFPKYEIVEIIK